jgi:hypothetical protein
VIEHLVMATDFMYSDVAQIARIFAQRVILHGCWNRLASIHKGDGFVYTLAGEVEIPLKGLASENIQVVAGDNVAPHLDEALSSIRRVPTLHLFSIPAGNLKQYIIQHGCIRLGAAQAEGPQAGSCVFVQQLRSFIVTPHRMQLP